MAELAPGNILLSHELHTSAEKQEGRKFLRMNKKKKNRWAQRIKERDFISTRVGIGGRVHLYSKNLNNSFYLVNWAHAIVHHRRCNRSGCSRLVCEVP